MRFGLGRMSGRFSAVLLVLILAVAPVGSALAAKMMPAFSEQTVNDQGRLESTALQGKVVLVNFWATWCPPCRKEIPFLAKLQDKYRDKGFVVVGVSMDEGGSKLVAKFLDKQKVNYPVIIGDAELARGFGGVIGVPATFLVDRKGELIRRYDGFATERELQEEIEKLLN